MPVAEHRFPRPSPGRFLSRRTALSAIAASLAAAVAAAQGLTVRISTDPAGVDPDGGSFEPEVSSTGRFVVFDSWADHAWGQTGGWTNVWRVDRETGVVSCSSAPAPGTGFAADNSSYRPSCSADGRFVAFDSGASNLFVGDANFLADVFVRDHAAGATERVSIALGGGSANGASQWASIAPDASCVTFASFATNLVPGDTNGQQDVFLRDRVAGTNERVSLGPSGAQGNGPSIVSACSDGGRFVAFSSLATNLVPGDTNALGDVFVRDRVAGTTERISVATTGAQASGQSGSPAITPDGRFVAFASTAPDLVPGDGNAKIDVFVRDRANGTTEIVSVRWDGVLGDGDSGDPSISADGRWVAFASLAGNLVPGDGNDVHDVFVHDRLTRTTARVSVAHGGGEVYGTSWFPAISGDGRAVAFASHAYTFVGGDGNNYSDVYLHERNAGQPEVYCAAALHSQGCAASIATSGMPSASSGQPFVVGAREAISQRPGFLAYAFAPASTPFPSGATLCLARPARRAGAQVSSGSPSACSGVYAFDFNAWIAAGTDPGLVPGTIVYAQWVFADPGGAGGLALTDAVAFAIAP